MRHKSNAVKHAKPCSNLEQEVADLKLRLESIEELVGRRFPPEEELSPNRFTVEKKNVYPRSEIMLLRQDATRDAVCKSLDVDIADIENLDNSPPSVSDVMLSALCQDLDTLNSELSDRLYSDRGQEPTCKPSETKLVEFLSEDEVSCNFDAIHLDLDSNDYFDKELVSKIKLMTSSCHVVPMVTICGDNDESNGTYEEWKEAIDSAAFPASSWSQEQAIVVSASVDSDTHGSMDLLFLVKAEPNAEVHEVAEACKCVLEHCSAPLEPPMAWQTYFNNIDDNTLVSSIPPTVTPKLRIFEYDMSEDICNGETTDE